MAFSEFLDSRRSRAKALVKLLGSNFRYVSILGEEVRTRSVSADRTTSNISSGRSGDCGFVIKATNGGAFFEYSLDDIPEDPAFLADRILAQWQMNAEWEDKMIHAPLPPDEPLVRSYQRETDIGRYTDSQLLSFCKQQCADLLECCSKLRNVQVNLSTTQTHKLFVTKHRELDQNYCWVTGAIFAVYTDNGKTVQTREAAYSHLLGDVLEQLPGLKESLLHKADILSKAKPIEPGIYDVITDPSISGLIAHEAFGHGVELDQFVKDRALAKEYMGKYVASPICNMRDGAASVLSTASYFFDDDGVPAADTQIIKDGILVAGISDLASAVQLGLAPTGNGRRESSRRKAYSRMTNTFFESGTDKLEDMIASVQHGYMLFDTNNGMEDPKNWAIQCVADYGIEIVDGKLTENYVSPVVMSGYVPDVLKSISMISDQRKIIGLGGCGKGYKEWIRVSDGGPALKVRVKLG